MSHKAFIRMVFTFRSSIALALSVTNPLQPRSLGIVFYKLNVFVSLKAW